MFGRRGQPHRTPGEGGRIVTVWGPTGAPGRSTIAAALAGALASRGRVVLVDADLTRGAQGVLLAADVGGNIASACRFPAPAGAPCPPDHLQAHRAGFHLLPGVPGPAQGVDVVPEELAALLARLRAAFDLVVVDVGCTLPDHEHGHGHCAALTAADRVLIVAAATRLGVSDVLLQYPVLAAHLASRRHADHLAGDGPSVWGVLNNGTGQGLETLRRRITRELDLPVVSYVPHDCRAVATARERSLPLTIACRHSPAAAALCRVAEGIWRDLRDAQGRHVER